MFTLSHVVFFFRMQKREAHEELIGLRAETTMSPKQDDQPTIKSLRKVVYEEKLL